jgi:uncharacterized protein (TIGR03000 family)
LIRVSRVSQLASVWLLAWSTLAAQSATSTRITVLVPHADARLEVDGRVVAGKGTTRTVTTPAWPRGTDVTVTITAQWDPNDYTKVIRTRTVTLRAGDAGRVDLTREDPADRVVVRYVPTPDDIAGAMVRLAGVTSNDVVFEPGCGDARITIEAVRAGARRGVCVDIDPARVKEARANVKKAGFADRIEIRQGDALDIPDLASASVVFLYMGDHFNMLMRPILWKQLKVGARVVSHRFTMGDWKPDNTVVTVSAEGGQNDLHIWTITETVKRRAAQDAARAVGRQMIGPPAAGKLRIRRRRSPCILVWL